HKVFNSPSDAIVWDVGHQCYPHKLLTGRAPQFHTLRRAGGISGFPKREESQHDIFDTGHSSTAISAALGLLEARKMNGTPGKVIAVIGDGTLTSGMAMEGLSNAGHLQLPLILVLNDNRMSISRSVGSISRYLSRLSASVRYQSMRVQIDNAILKIPRFGKILFEYVTRSKNAVKELFFKENLFSEFGFEYVGPIDGHNLGTLIAVFEQVRQLERPVVVHVVTTKGKGLDRAEEDPEAFHGVSPSCSDQPISSSHSEPPPFLATPQSFTAAFSEALIRAARHDDRVVAITAAMASGTGVAMLGQQMPDRVFDVGIAEQHAVTFAAGMARGGLLPVVAIYSTFMQRAVDQVFQDVCLAGLPVLFALDRAGAVGEDGETHQGIYDIPLYKSMPNLVFFAPADDAELDAFMRCLLYTS
ncbi:MAG: 1-deoxy-D-xylulose-5-phosphate synthase, partial [Rectinema sp.]|nr:1-deoxy-D-xylulose-5-phosphate synthase [Rectinema sp.]